MREIYPLVFLPLCSFPCSTLLLGPKRRHLRHLLFRTESTDMFPAIYFLLGALPVSYAQSCDSSNQNQQDLCSSFCVVSAQCNNQCSNKPSNEYVRCLCQDVCLCSMEICQSCCTVAGPQYEQAYCRSEAVANLNFCMSPAVRCSSPFCKWGQRCELTE